MTVKADQGREKNDTPSCAGRHGGGYIFFPQPLVDGFSKLWLRGKGNLRVETLIPAGSMPGFMPARARGQKTAIFIRFSAKNMQKQQYLQGFLQRACKNSSI